MTDKFSTSNCLHFSAKKTTINKSNTYYIRRWYMLWKKKNQQWSWVGSTGAAGCNSRARPHCRERGARVGRAVLRIKVLRYRKWDWKRAAKETEGKTIGAKPFWMQLQISSSAPVMELPLGRSAERSSSTQWRESRNMGKGVIDCRHSPVVPILSMKQEATSERIT